MLLLHKIRLLTPRSNRCFQLVLTILICFFFHSFFMRSSSTGCSFSCPWFTYLPSMITSVNAYFFFSFLEFFSSLFCCSGNVSCHTNGLSSCLGQEVFKQGTLVINIITRYII